MMPSWQNSLLFISANAKAARHVKSHTLQRRALLVAATVLLMTTSLRGQTADALDAVYVATYLDVRSMSTSEGAALATQYEHATRSDAGNVAVKALQEIGRSNRFVIVETWRDPAAFADHERAAHTLQFREKLRAIHRSPYDQRVNHGFAVDPLPQTSGSKAIYVVTHVDVPGARRQEAEILLKQLFEPSHVDPSHVRYDIYQQNEPRTNHFTILAVWNSRRAFDAYGGTPHWLQFREALAPMLGALYDERLYQTIRP